LKTPRQITCKQGCTEAIGQLYMIDAKAEGDLAKRTELRKGEPVIVLDELKTWLWS
jgi:hypothetical protein